MSDNGPSDTGKPAGSNRARQLFGHRSGAKPWGEAPQGGEEPAAQSAPANSAPYPRDATYTPRPQQPDASAAPNSIFSEVDDETELTRLHPNYKLLMRIGALVLGIAILIGGIVLDGILQANALPIPFGVVSVPALILAVFVFLRIPNARFNARGYQISRDRLRVVRGVLWRSDTIVPFGRVQHIDVDQGPIERALDIATLTLHTAGNHNSSVKLPGLGHELATQMREEIRGHIKRETL